MINEIKETPGGFKYIEVSSGDCFKWGGGSVCDLCNDYFNIGYLMPVLNSCICKKCFERYKTLAIDEQDKCLQEDISERFFKYHLDLVEKNDVTLLDKLKEICEILIQTDIVRDEKFPFILHHPIITSDTYMLNGKLKIIDLDNEESVEEVRNLFRKALTKIKDVSTFLTFINKPYLLDFFMFASPFMSRKDFAEFLIASWTYMEFPNRADPIANETKVDWFRSISNKEWLMEPEELEAYNKLPDKIRVYRGVGSHRNINALSWTTDLEKAKWFANRFGEKDGKVYTTEVNKEDVFAYKLDRGESEVILDFTTLDNIKEIGG